MDKQTLSIALDDADARALARAADALGLPQEEVAREALRDFLAVCATHEAHIREGLGQADAGTFVDEADWRAALKPRA